MDSHDRYPVVIQLVVSIFLDIIMHIIVLLDSLWCIEKDYAFDWTLFLNELSLKQNDLKVLINFVGSRGQFTDCHENGEFKAMQF